MEDIIIAQFLGRVAVFAFITGLLFTAIGFCFGLLFYRMRELGRKIRLLEQYVQRIAADRRPQLNNPKGG